MKLLRLVPVLLGVAILLFGIYLVSSHGYVGATYLPSLIGISPCSTGSSSSNSTGCTGFSPYGALGVGTIVCIFGLGILASSIRRAAAGPSSGTPSLSPETLTALAQAHARFPSAAPGPRPGTVYCHNCGAGNPAEAKFCHQCASPMPVSPPAVPSGGPPTTGS